MPVVFLQRVADALGVLASAFRALKFAAPFTVTPRPGLSLSGASGDDGQVTDYIEIGIDPAVLAGLGVATSLAGVAGGWTTATARTTDDVRAVVLEIPVASNSLVYAEWTCIACRLHGGIPDGPTILIRRGSAAIKISGTMSAVSNDTVGTDAIDAALAGADAGGIGTTSIRLAVVGLPATTIRWSVSARWTTAQA